MNNSVSIVIPTKNSSDTLPRTLQSIAELNYPRDAIEVIIVDGYSSDGTVAIAKEYGCHVLYENRGTIAYARDIGVKAAQGKFIAFTDSDCVVEKNWLKELSKHFDDEEVAAVGGPNLTPGDDTQFAKCVGTVLAFLSSFGARYGLSGGKIAEIHHNPTCNVMYRKEVLEEVDGFNHNLVTADDEELDYRIRERGYKLLYTPLAVVCHYRRPTWQKYVQMAYNYGLGRAQAIRLHKRMAKWFHFVPSFIVVVIASLLILSMLSEVFFWSAAAILISGGIGIAAMALYLNRDKNGFFTTYGLVVIWFLGWAIGFLGGAFAQLDRQTKEANS